MPVIFRSFEWDAGHRVLGHEGKCKRLHGHRYKATVYVEAPALDKLDRVIDFGDMKKIIQGWIDEHWDHNFICHEDDPILDSYPPATCDPDERTMGSKEQQLAQVFAGKHPYVMLHGTNPTAEALAEELYEQVDPLLPRPLKIVKIELWETPNCGCEYVPTFLPR